MDVQKAERALLQYVQQIGLNEKDCKVKMKLVHSQKVSELSQKLGKKLELSQEQLDFVRVLGLLHDIGRFEQLRRSDHYDDQISKLDHASLGVEYLFTQGHIVDFVDDRSYDSLFQVAIANHNRLEIEANLSLEEEFYCHFLRDIDVIDIFRQQAVSEEFNYASPVGEEAERQFLEHRLIDRSVLKEPSDSILVEIAYVFGIHFQESYELLVELDNLNLFLDSIAVDPSMEEDFHAKKEEVYRYILHQLEETRKDKPIQ